MGCFLCVVCGVYSYSIVHTVYVCAQEQFYIDLSMTLSLA